MYSCTPSLTTSSTVVEQPHQWTNTCLMTPYMQANSTYKEERQKILQSREKKREKDEQKAKLTAEGRTILFPPLTT